MKINDNALIPVYVFYRWYGVEMVETEQMGQIKMGETPTKNKTKSKTKKTIVFYVCVCNAIYGCVSFSIFVS